MNLFIAQLISLALIFTYHQSNYCYLKIINSNKAGVYSFVYNQLLAVYILYRIRNSIFIFESLHHQKHDFIQYKILYSCRHSYNNHSQCRFRNVHLTATQNYIKQIIIVETNYVSLLLQECKSKGVNHRRLLIIMQNFHR